MQKKAFTLIELMIVVAIIGILAAIAIPNFIKFQCRSKQSEAKGNLKAIYVSEESYRGENDAYVQMALTGNGTTNPANVIGFAPKGAKIRYNYTVGAASATTFHSTAIGNAEMNTDKWTITQANDLQQGENGAAITSGAGRGCD